ncbi:hypothetical protein E4U52_000434, partial [Claviceps spartinae]
VGPIVAIDSLTILAVTPGVNIPVDSKSATKKRQESTNKNAQSSQRLRDKKRIKAEAAIKKVKEMKQELDEERKRSRQKDERLRRQAEELQKKK